MTIHNFINATDARNNFFDLLARIKNNPYPINITVKGIPEAVIMSKEDFDAWMATFETISDPELMKSLRQSERDFTVGNYYSLDQIEKELGLKKLADGGKKKYVSREPVKRGQKRS